MSSDFSPLLTTVRPLASSDLRPLLKEFAYILGAVGQGMPSTVVSGINEDTPPFVVRTTL